MMVVTRILCSVDATYTHLRNDTVQNIVSGTVYIKYST